MRRLPYHCLLHGDFIRDRIDRENQNQKYAAELLDISPSYLSQLLDGKRAASPAVRRKLRACPLFQDVPDESLWERVSRSDAG